jgi:UDP-hydrolysing UDP-N-acetyl-D-glucosamine 2-epimerase
MKTKQKKVRTIGVVTVARSDYGIYRPILLAIRKQKNLRLHLIVAADHLCRRRGMTVQEIESDGFDIGDRIKMSPPSDTPAGIAFAMAKGIEGFAKVFRSRKPDLLLVLGDRFEMHAAVSAAMPFGMPVAHLHGGEITEGAVDNQFRHSISKMSHFHFVATKENRRRLLRMGEEPWRVIVTGAPALDNVRAMQLMTPAEIERETGIKLAQAPLIVTFHSVTLEPDKTALHIGELLAALDRVGLPVLFTYPNVDMGSRLIVSAIQEYLKTHRDCRLVKSLGTRLYFSVMKHAAAMVGNSSSGIIEAASLHLPVVNVGNRQGGRLHGRNVMDVQCERTRLAAAIRRVTSPSFKSRIRGLRNPYGDGNAAARIVSMLSEITLDPRLVMKKWHDADREK